MLEGVGAELADAALGAYDEGERESVPVFVSVRWVLCGGFEGAPVAAVVAGDVGAVGAYGDPGFGGGVVGYGAAVAVGWVWGLSETEWVIRTFIPSCGHILLLIVATHNYGLIVSV